MPMKFLSLTKLISLYHRNQQLSEESFLSATHSDHIYDPCFQKHNGEAVSSMCSATMRPQTSAQAQLAFLQFLPWFLTRSKSNNSRQNQAFYNFFCFFSVRA